MTRAPAHTVSVGPTQLTVSDTRAGVQRTGDEAWQTLALGLSVLDAALSVRAARVIADVLTPATHTDALIWTASVSTGAASLGEAPGLVRVTHLALGAETTEASGGGPALGGSVTRIVAAGIDGGAGNLGQGVGPGARGTGALGHLVLGETDGVGAAGVGCAHVHALVAQSVTELGGRTVKVGQTAHGSAAQHWVCRVSFELARGTGAPGRVVLGDAHGLGATGDGVTGRDTLPLTLAAHLLLPALGVGLALVLGGQVTALPVLGVAAVSFKTVTEALMIAGPTLRVLRTREQLTHWGAAEYAHLVRFADLVLGAAGVIGAAWHGGQLTLVGQGVPDGSGAALAVGPVVPDHALLGAAAAHHAARVHTAPLAADVDAAHVTRGTVGGC